MINKDGGHTAVMRGDIELMGSPPSPPPPATGKTLSFVKICTYVKLHVITFERDKSIILIEAFRDCHISSFTEGNLHSLLFITSALEASFSSLLRRPSHL